MIYWTILLCIFHCTKVWLVVEKLLPVVTGYGFTQSMSYIQCSNHTTQVTWTLLSSEAQWLGVWGLESKAPDLESSTPAVWPWASYLTTPCLKLLFQKRKWWEYWLIALLWRLKHFENCPAALMKFSHVWEHHMPHWKESNYGDALQSEGKLGTSRNGNTVIAVVRMRLEMTATATQQEQ